MTKEQEETIKKLEYYLQNSAYKRVDSDFFKNGGWEIVDLEIPQAIETGLNIIKIKDKEIEKKDKIIDLMAEYISNLDIDEDICMKNIANTELCNEKYSNCKECIKQYFEKKVEEKENKGEK